MVSDGVDASALVLIKASVIVLIEDADSVDDDDSAVTVVPSSVASLIVEAGISVLVSVEADC